MKQADYVAQLLAAWARFPRTSRRSSRYDVLIARQLWSAGAPLENVLAAIRLTAMRLAARQPDSPPLPPPRSLAYVVPVIDELRHADPDYLQYLLDGAVQLSTISGDR